MNTSVGRDWRGQPRAPAITCAGPSPAVAKAVAEAHSLASSLDTAIKGAKLPVEGRLGSTLALSASRAEALAQLTNRLATIHLRRDARYRACEAYTNGAMTETSYAVLLSRNGDTVVTLLIGELAGVGNLGQRLVTLGAGAAGSASAPLTPVVASATHSRSDARVSEPARTSMRPLRSAFTLILTEDLDRTKEVLG